MTLQYTIIKRIAYLLLIGTLTTTAYAQHPAHNKEARERIDAARIGYITKELDLTPEQAEKFWPVFNEFSDKRRSFREDFHKEMKDKSPEELTDEDKMKILDHEIEVKEKELALTKEYKDRFLEILSIDQMIALKHSEDDFRRMLLNKMKHRQSGEGNENLHKNRHENKREYRRKGPH